MTTNQNIPEYPREHLVRQGNIERSIKKGDIATAATEVVALYNDIVATHGGETDELLLLGTEPGSLQFNLDLLLEAGAVELAVPAAELLLAEARRLPLFDAAVANIWWRRSWLLAEVGRYEEVEREVVILGIAQSGGHA